MSYNDKIGIRAGADLSGKQYMAIAVGGTVAGSEAAAFGVLCNKPQSGEDASVAIAGRVKVKAGAALTAGALLGVNATGYFVPVNSGFTSIGRAVNAVSSGGVTEAIVNFANIYKTS